MPELTGLPPVISFYSLKCSLFLLVISLNYQFYLSFPSCFFNLPFVILLYVCFFFPFSFSPPLYFFFPVFLFIRLLFSLVFSSFCIFIYSFMFLTFYFIFVLFPCASYHTCFAPLYFHRLSHLLKISLLNKIFPKNALNWAYERAPGG